MRVFDAWHEAYHKCQLHAPAVIGRRRNDTGRRRNDSDSDMDVNTFMNMGHTFDPERNEEFFRRYVAFDEDPDQSDREIPNRESESFVHDDTDSPVHRDEQSSFV